jgi:hypothetical protein
MGSMDPKDDEDDSKVALVFVEYEDSQGSRQSTKIRVRRSDLVAHGEEFLTGPILNRILLDRCGNDGDGDGSSVELFDFNDNTFCSLLEHCTEWRQCNLVKRIGTRLRARIIQQRVPNHSADQEERLAIQGRFYPYNGSLEIAGTSIQVEEQLNTPEEGTAGNVWDGAIML